MLSDNDAVLIDMYLGDLLTTVGGTHHFPADAPFARSQAKFEYAKAKLEYVGYTVAKLADNRVKITHPAPLPKAVPVESGKTG